MAPIIEEIDDEDIDNMEYDPADFEPNNPFDKTMPVEGGVRLRSTQQEKPAAASQASSRGATPAPGPETLFGAGGPPPGTGVPGVPGAGGFGPGIDGPNVQSGTEMPEHMKSWSVLYPIYFDATRSHADGRRVPLDLAVKAPLATTIVDACKSLGYDAGFEVTKGHPNDWANPGRVRVKVEGSKRQLFRDIAKYLQAHPANAKTARVDMYRRIAEFNEPHPLAVPHGMKIGHTLPGVSPALSASKFLENNMGMDKLGQMFGGMGG